MNNIKEHYESLDNEVLLRIAVNEANQLTPEAVEALIEVLIEKGVNLELIKNIHLQCINFSDAELNEIAYTYSNLKCPICNMNKKINAIKLKSIMGLIVFSGKENKVVIGCRECLMKGKKAVNKKNLLLGWWSAHGIFQTPIAIISNNLNFEKIDKNFGTLSDEFLDFVKKNIGVVLNEISFNSISKE